MRGKGSASAHRHGVSPPCTHDEGRSCPSTLTNPMRFGYAPGLCTLDRTHGALPPETPASGLSRPDTHEQERGPCTPFLVFAWRSTVSPPNW